MNKQQWASRIHAELWANFRKHGYPEKVSLNVQQLVELIDAQDGRCYDSGRALTDKAIVKRVAKGPINNRTIVIVEEADEVATIGH